jgi:dTDP-4-dehydrorhamnose reductase
MHIDKDGNKAANSNLELWGGLECTVNRVRDQYFCQMERNGHVARDDDIERFISLGIRAIRYPVLWERTAPDGIARADWSIADARLPRLREGGVNPIVGLVHHGSGPRHTSLIDPQFATGLAQFAGAVARRYPWINCYTPVNEPLTTARFSGLYGVWYPHGRDEPTFVQALLNQCRATALSMRAIRQINPAAQLIQTDDLGKSYGTDAMSALAAFFNERRWLGWDLLCGKVDPNHALWGYLIESGANPADILWFSENPCPPDVLGINYYVTGERWLDERTDRFPERYVGEYRGSRYADIETSRVLATPTPGVGPLLQEAWDRYRIPIAVTEAHIDAHREDQMRWLLEVWQAAEHTRENGADIRAVTVWALLGSYDWNCLVTECKGYYEPGPYDVRSPAPRATAVAAMMREMSAGRELSHPVLQGKGWWRRPGRFLCKPVAAHNVPTSLFHPEVQHPPGVAVQPILITGATGTLGSAFARLCEQRNLTCRVLARHDMDIADRSSVERAIALHAPWAVINASGFVRVDAAEHAFELCHRENAIGPSVLADACAANGIQFLTFSSDLVFDGAKGSPYVESDPVSPLNQYGRSKAEAEQRVLDRHPEAMVVRTSAFFGPWDQHNFVTQALRALRERRPFAAAEDMVVSPTYVPDLVHACLDLLIDRESGIWHLSHGEAISWAGLARKAAALCGIDAATLNSARAIELRNAAPRPAYSALSSERGN